jgi:hypothetical protein
MTFAMAFERCDKTTYTSSDDEDVDARWRVAMDIVLLLCQVMIDMRGIQLLDEVRHGGQSGMVCSVYCRAVHFLPSSEERTK